ncbi:MAG: ABC transporter permease [Acidimicrobiales bacterium]
MGRLLKAEGRKLRSMLQTWIIAGSCLVLTVFFLVIVTVSDDTAASGVPPIETDEGVRNIVNQGTTALAFVLVLGTLLVTSEYRHQTITSTFLVEPRRGRILTAKFIVGGLVGLVVTTLTVILVLAVALTWLAAIDVSIGNPSDLVVLPAVGTVLAGVGYALLGVAVGALLRNQIAALVGSLVWITLIDPILGAVLPDVASTPRPGRRQRSPTPSGSTPAGSTPTSTSRCGPAACCSSGTPWCSSWPPPG